MRQHYYYYYLLSNIEVFFLYVLQNSAALPSRLFLSGLKMAARFSPRWTNPGSAGVALLLCLSAAIATAPISRVRNGYNYTFFGRSRKAEWLGAKRACPQGMLWLEGIADLKWVIFNFLPTSSDDFWLAAKGVTSVWANGKAIPSGITVSEPPTSSSDCASVDVSKMEIKWKSCSDSKLVICKPMALPPTPACTNSATGQLYRRLTTNQRQNGTELEAVAVVSKIACSARCVRHRFCCAFEFWAESGRCRLLADALPMLWVAEIGSEVFGMQPAGA